MGRQASTDRGNAARGVQTPLDRAHCLELGWTRQRAEDREIAVEEAQQMERGEDATMTAIVLFLIGVAVGTGLLH